MVDVGIKQARAEKERIDGGLRVRGTATRGDARQPLVSVITVVFNSATTLEETICSVLQQSYENIEYIVIDGGSNDGTLDIIRRYDDRIDYWLSEPDKGIYDAMNKGISLATGDYVGMLNADDMFANSGAVQTLVERSISENLDAVFSWLDIVDPNDAGKILRRYRVKRFNAFMLKIGVMPPHPTFYCRRSCYKKLGATPYRTDYRIAADFELLVRLLQTQNISWACVEETTVMMRAGGVSSGSFRSRLMLNREIIRACKENGLYTNMLLLLMKIPLRFLEHIRR